MVAGEHGAPEKPPRGWYTWTLQISVCPKWVADGAAAIFGPRLHRIPESLFSWFCVDEIWIKVLKSPHPDQIRAEETGKTVNGKEPRYHE